MIVVPAIEIRNITTVGHLFSPEENACRDQMWTESSHLGSFADRQELTDVDSDRITASMLGQAGHTEQTKAASALDFNIHCSFQKSLPLSRVTAVFKSHCSFQ